MAYIILFMVDGVAVAWPTLLTTVPSTGVDSFHIFRFCTPLFHHQQKSVQMGCKSQDVRGLQERR